MLMIGFTIPVLVNNFVMNYQYTQNIKYRKERREVCEANSQTRSDSHKKHEQNTNSKKTIKESGSAELLSLAGSEVSLKNNAASNLEMQTSDEVDLKSDTGTGMDVDTTSNTSDNDSGKIHCNGLKYNGDGDVTGLMEISPDIQSESCPVSFSLGDLVNEVKS